jgi:hypothetical protein
LLGAEEDTYINTAPYEFAYGSVGAMGIDVPNDLLKPMSEMAIKESCRTMNNTVTIAPPLARRMAKFSKKSRRYIGKKERMLTIKTRRGPNRSTISGKPTN